MPKKLFLLLICLVTALSICSCDSCEHMDATDDGMCDICGETYTNACDIHRDADDDGKCDNGGENFTDDCDIHRDANDDGKCDNGGENFTDDCDIHRDADDDGKCDNGGEAYTDGYDNPLDGKKIIFIGNSYTYYGQTVLETSQTILTQEARTDDRGYFYQLCQDNGADVEVTNWTFGGHSLAHLFGGNCAANRGCNGVDHKAYLTDRAFDYVVVQPGNSAASSASFLSDMETVMSLFKAANPNVKFVVLVPYSAYGTIGSTICLATEFLNGLKTVADQGVTVVDWGGLVMNILNGDVTVPGTALDYVKNTFVISKSASDGYHPNQLSGYITTLMTYCAITGESALGKSYDFCNDSSLRPEGSSEKFFSFDTFIKWFYKDGATTNFPDVFASENDMSGIQSLINEHLEAKAYLNYNYSDQT